MHGERGVLRSLILVIASRNNSAVLGFLVDRSCGRADHFDVVFFRASPIFFLSEQRRN